MRNHRAALVALLMVSACGCGKKVEPVTPAAPVAVQGATVSTLSFEAIAEQQEAVGTVRARSSALICARVAGNVSGVWAREGERVAKGEPLVSIEVPESAAAAAGAAAGVEEAGRALQEARSRKKLADATFERYRRLFGEQAVTRQEFEVRQSEQETAEQAVAGAEARLNRARQGAKAAGAVAGYGRVASPIAGLVLARQVEGGQTVFPGTPLFTVEGEDGFRLEVQAPEGLLGKVKPGDPLDIAVQGAPATGRVSEVVPLVDPASRTFIVKIDLAGKGLRSGTFGKALFRSGSCQGIVVPVSAVVERGSLTSVWLVSPQGIARLRLVRLGRGLGRRVEVISGLNPGDKIVTAGAERVSDGAKVQ